MGALTGTIVGLGAKAVGMGMSMAQQRQQRQAAQKANADAARIAKDVEDMMKINYAESLSITKEAFAQERQANLVAGAQLTQTGAESERGAASAAGQLLMAQQNAQAKTRAAVEQQMVDRQRDIVSEDIRARDYMADMGQDRIAGAQLAARQADEAALKAQAQAVQGGVNLLQEVGQIFEGDDTLYSKMGRKKNFRDVVTQTIMSDEALADMRTINANGVGLKDMSKKEFANFIQGLSPEQQKQILDSSEYAKALENIEAGGTANPFDIYR
jgi:hypothetical protein